MPDTDTLTLTRAELEALAKEFRHSYIDPNRSPDLRKLVDRIDTWLAARPIKVSA